MKKSNSINYIEGLITHVIESTKDFVTKESRIELFNVFNKLSNVILAEKYGVKPELASEIAVSYSINLVDKFITQKWLKLSGADISAYVQVDLEKHLKVPFTQADMDILKAFEAHSLMPDENMLNYEIFCEINDILLLFFDISEVKRYLPLFLVTVSNCKLRKISGLRDENFKYFCMLLISLSRKVSKYYVNGPCNLNHKDFSLGELTYLLSPNLEKHPELYLNLDLSSLKNLVDMCGGKTIVVPTQEELNEGFKQAQDSFRLAPLQKIQDELSELTTDESEPCIDSAFEFFNRWLTSNADQLSPTQLDRLLKTLGK